MVWPFDTIMITSNTGISATDAIASGKLISTGLEIASYRNKKKQIARFLNMNQFERG
jgi:hypothetical protein